MGSYNEGPRSTITRKDMSLRTRNDMSLRTTIDDTPGEIEKAIPEELHVSDNASLRSSIHSATSTPTHHDSQDGDESIEPRALESGRDSDKSNPTAAGPPWSIFTIQQKRFIVFMVALATFFSPLSANIYFPALNTVAPSIMNLTLTTYMIFQGIAPTIFGDLADMAGRRPAYLIGFTVYIAACIGIASCDSFAALLVLRCFQSSGSSSTVALGAGVVADIATSDERGVWMGWATAGPMYVVCKDALGKGLAC